AMAYNNRLKPLRNSCAELDEAILEAEALFGSEIAEIGKKLTRSYYNRLLMSMEFVTRRYARESRPNTEKVKEESDCHADEGENDDLSLKIKEAVDRLEFVLSPYITKRKA